MTMAELSGRTLGQYRLRELIGIGGMASVYRARQESMDRDVAIKIMAMQLAENEEFVARFEREARVIAKLQHPHILPVIDFGRDAGYIFLVMRLVEGGVLSERLMRTTLSVRQADRFLTQVGSALEYAHLRGVIHRDLKPNNVLLDEEDNAYLTDFGIAKMLAGTSTSQLNLTATGSVMGTPAYMAPEQWRSEPVDARTDIYALGIILYEMLMGVLPFQADTPFGMMYKHFDTPPPLPRLINPRLPEPIEQVMLTALAKNANDRYPSARQMAEAFSAAMRIMSPELIDLPLPRATAEQIAQATPPALSRPQATRPQATVATRAEPYPYGESGAYPGYAPPAAPLPRSEQRMGRGRGILVGGAILALIAAAVVIALLVINGGDDTPDRTEPAVLAADVTQTGTARVQDAITPPTTAPTSVLDTATPEKTAVDQIVPVPDTDTPSPEPTATPSVTPSRTPLPRPSDTPPPTSTPTETPDLNMTAEALLALRLSQIAAAWTDTPTPDIEASVIAAMTGTASAWTRTPTPTSIPTLPPPPTRTLPPPTSTLTPTITQRPPTLRPSPTATPACTMRARVARNGGARTTLLPDDPTRIRRTPGFSGGTERSIPPGQMFWVADGPQCVDDVLWWLVQGVDQAGSWSGWIGEGMDGTYWIEPFVTGPVECPGAPSPRLVPGETGRVTVDPPVPSRVRSAPKIDTNNQIGTLQPGTTFEVITGPVCDTANGWRWWQVRTPSLEGWVAEGPAGEYWMEPWP